MNTRAPYLLGIDPGFAAVGLARLRLGQATYTIERMAVVRTAKSAKKHAVYASDDNVRRAAEIAAALEPWLDGVAVIAAEAMSYPPHAAAASKMGICWGVIATLARAHQIAIVQTNPQAIKLHVVGRKTASKDDVIMALARAHGAPLSDAIGGVPAGLHEHACDALAAALTCLGSDAVRAVRRAAPP